MLSYFDGAFLLGAYVCEPSMTTTPTWSWALTKYNAAINVESSHLHTASDMIQTTHHMRARQYMRPFVILNNHLFHNIGHSCIATAIEVHFTVIPCSVKIHFCAVILHLTVLYSKKGWGVLTHNAAETAKCERFFMQIWFAKYTTEVNVTFISLFDSFNVRKVQAENWFASLNVSWQVCEKYHYLYEKIEEAELQNSIQPSV